MRPIPRAAGLLTAFLLLPVVAAKAQDDAKVKVEARFVPAQAAPGTAVVLEVHGTIEPGYHIYGGKDPGIPTRLVVAANPLMVAKGAPVVPPGTKHEQFGGENWYLEDEFVLKQSFTVGPGAIGKVVLTGKVHYMACTDEACDPPAEAAFTATLQVEPGAAPQGAQAATPQGAAPAIAKPVSGPKLTFTPQFEPAQAKAGDQVTLVLLVQVDDGWHVYGSAEQNSPRTELIELDGGGLVPTGDVDIPAGSVHRRGGEESHELDGEFAIKQVFTVPAGVAPGFVPVTGKLSYQPCDASTCLPPTALLFTAALRVLPADGASADGAPAAGAVAGQDPPPASKPLSGPKVTFTPHFEPAVVRAGERTTLVLKVQVDDGWHVYGSAEENSPRTELLDLDAGGMVLVGEPEVPPGTLHGKGTHDLDGEFTIKQTIAVPGGMSPGLVTVSGKLTWQPCDESTCLPPATVPFTAAVRVLPPDGAAPAGAGAGGMRGQGSGDGPRQGVTGQSTREAQPAPRGQPDRSGTSDNSPRSTKGADDAPMSLWQLLLECIAGGLLALAMPCTYPMIPITFSFFTKQAEQRHGNVLGLALIYGIGIVLMFVVIGLAFGKVIIPFAGHWATNLVLAIAFVFFALSLFGLFTLQLPASWQDAAGRAGRTGGLAGVFFMGATLVVSSFTCTGPVVALLLARAGQGRDLGGVAIGMAVFGLTMALPFVVLSLLPGRVKQMPRSGEWMNALKVTLGFVELAAALKFASNVEYYFDLGLFPRELFLLTCSALFLLNALYLFGSLRLAGQSTVGIGPGRLVSGLAFFALAFYMLYGATGQKLGFIAESLAPPYSAATVNHEEFPGAPANGAGAVKATGHTIVYDDPDRAFAQAKREGKLVLINFTGFFCVNCRGVENDVFPNPKIASLLRAGFIESRQHVDVQKTLTAEQFARNKQMQAEIVGNEQMPYFAIVDPKTRQVLRQTKLGSTDWVGLMASFLTGT